jgi:hypothetical protein
VDGRKKFSLEVAGKFRQFLLKGHLEVKNVIQKFLAQFTKFHSANSNLGIWYFGGGYSENQRGFVEVYDLVS